MMKTTVVSIPRKPRGLMKREGKTNLTAKSNVLSNLSHAHLRRAIIGSSMPFFLVCPANSGFSVKVISYDVVARIHSEPDPRKRPESEVESWSRDGHRRCQEVLAAVARALQPVLLT